ncbi:MAG: hypothetical protein RLZZ397_850 [Pseudomonadota bacterium]
MKVRIRRMGNSRGILIPKAILTQLGLGESAELQVRDGLLEIKPLAPHPRSGWELDAARIASEGHDELVWPELPNDGDELRDW